MDTSDKRDRLEVEGRVKWFDPAKGFGFVVSDEGGPDILLHANVLRNFGQSSLADGAGIRLVVQQTERGVQAYEVLEITPPENPAGAGLTDIAEYDPEYIANLPLEPVRIKWFDKVKGFGFGNVFGQDEDIFVHIEVLRQSGFSDLAVGEAVCLKVIEGKRGRMAAEVLAWDMAVRQRRERSE
ncbi:cold-shock protein [Flavimaricola marinus]|uniref:Cold shock protein CspV n=1 Tax=Flavimaricola marinus TaxID=1819565 RepID=A0A238LG89_9RHOB|nr:cold shock domain-containing protein [Flavimaricola marinus]SMY07976.1 Cold shock protein CspV [Flavimaricola marinus]